MKLIFKHLHPLFILLPAITAFLITLIPTLNYGWPLSWDIIFHVGYAQNYSQYGLSLQKSYPPLFHLLIAALGNLFNSDYFQIARFLQPVIAMAIVLSVTYISKKLYGDLIGISAGFLMISSYIIFRIMLPIPENLAIIFFSFSIYFYYLSLSKKILKHALIAGILLILVISTHLAAVICLLVVITSFTLIDLIINKKMSTLKHFSAFFLPLIILIIAGTFMLLLFKSEILNNIMQQGLFNFMGFSTSLSFTRSLSIYGYLKYFGILLSLFAIIGCIFTVKNRDKKNIFILTWITSLFLLSVSYLFGINVESDRVLIYILIPLSILGGYGLVRFYSTLEGSGYFNSSRIKYVFLITIFLLSLVSGISTAEKSFTFNAQSKFGSVQIAPPSPSEFDLANWLNVNGDQNKKVIISNTYSGILLNVITNMAILNFENFNKNISKSILDSENIGYVIFDKRLTVQSENETLYFVDGGSGLFYYSGDIHITAFEVIPDSAVVAYENSDFIVFQL